MKNKTFLQSVRCAFVGAFYAVRTEKNFRYYIGIYTFFFIINCLIHLEFTLQLLPMMCVFGACSAEMLNTAVEHLSDDYTSEIRNEIRLVKDIAAAGVLMWGFAFFIIEGIYICRWLF